MTTESAPHSLLLDPVQPLIDYHGVGVGEELPPVSFDVTHRDVEDYHDAVGAVRARPWVATMHLLAITLAAITERMPLPPTCVHVGQELEWTRAVQAGATVHVRFGLLSRRIAGGSMLSAFSLHLSSDGGQVARGRILLQS